MITKELVIKTLQTIQDPELGIDVWTLGLIYSVTPREDGVDILMTLTSAMCPFADELIKNIEDGVGALLSEDEGASVRVELTFDPPWEPSEELRVMLGV